MNLVFRNKIVILNTLHCQNFVRGEEILLHFKHLTVNVSLCSNTTLQRTNHAFRLSEGRSSTHESGLRSNIRKMETDKLVKKKNRVLNNKYMTVRFKSVGVYLHDKSVYTNMMR